MIADKSKIEWTDATWNPITVCSVEDQTRADKRIPLLPHTPAAERFVSYEPALGPVDFRDLNVKTIGGIEQWDCLDVADARDAKPPATTTIIDRIIAWAALGTDQRCQIKSTPCRHVHPWFAKQTYANYG